MITLYPPSSRLFIEEVETPESVFKESEKLFVTSLHLYHENVNGATPPGLSAVRFPFCDPDELQKMNIGSFTAVYLLALIPGAESWAAEITGNKTAIIRKK
jgi:hypothetical protein